MPSGCFTFLWGASVRGSEPEAPNRAVERIDPNQFGLWSIMRTTCYNRDIDNVTKPLSRIRFSGPREDLHLINLGLVESYLTAIERRDFGCLENILAPEGFTYLGPTQRFSSATAFIQDLERIGSILKRIERRRLIVDGEDVCDIFDLCSTIPELEQVRIACWFRLRNGRIYSIETFFDARPYARLFEDAGVLDSY
mgnify:CR=1 FL=1